MLMLSMRIKRIRISWIKDLFVYILLSTTAISLVVSQQEVLYEFDLNLHHNIPTLHCPEDWEKIGLKCIHVVRDIATFSQAEDICRSFGGTLLRIDGYNLNKEIGKTVEKVIANGSITDEIDFVWIGIFRDDSGNYMWQHEQVALVEEGIWAPLNPPAFQPGFKKCGMLGINDKTEFGSNRWYLSECEEKHASLCEVKPCTEGGTLCADGQKCIPHSWFCDGILDCDDESDESFCNNAECGGELSGVNGTFQSPNYPLPYPNYANCQWKISSPSGTKIKIMFTAVNLEEDFDYVVIHDGPSILDNRLVELTGVDLPKHPVISTANFVLVVLESDRSDQLSGFSANWKAVTLCGGSLESTAEAQSISSPNHPQTYPTNLLCEWILTASHDEEIINLQFNEFDLEDLGDWLEVHEGTSETGGLYGRFTGTTLPKIIVSRRNSLFIRFKSDIFTNSRSGFHATFSTGCNVVITQTAVVISSPGYGVSNYPNSIDCSWNFKSTRNQRVSLVFDDDFDTETRMDVVTVYTSKNSSELGKYSGREQPVSVSSELGELYITFKADQVVTKTGWQAVISPDCPPVVPLPTNSSVDVETTQCGSQIHYTCDTGFQLFGANPRICDIGGVWTSPPPSCQLRNCGSPNVSDSSSLQLVRLSSHLYGGVATYRCNLGYLMTGQPEVLCSEYGWDPLPECKEIICPKLRRPENCDLTVSAHSKFAEVATFSCHDSFHLVGHSVIYCTQNGSWSNEVPSCQKPSCPVLYILNGQLNATEPVRYGDRVQITCHDGYELKGEGHFQCSDSGEYNRTPGTCQDINECDSSNPCGIHVCQNTPGSYRCKCEKGYRHNDRIETKCQDVDECAMNNGDCSHTCVNMNGSYTCQCDTGYQLFDGDDAMILDDEVFLPSKTCIVTCPEFSVTHGTIHANRSQMTDGSFVYPTSVYSLCSSGYTLIDGPPVLYCQVDGTWTHSVKCQEYQCGKLTAPENGVVDVEAYTKGSKAKYICKSGYKLEGTGLRVCQITATKGYRYTALWTGKQPNCKAVSCLVPPFVENGFVSYNNSEVGSLAEYRCRCGYRLSGSVSRTCLESGVWSGINTVCNPESCGDLENPDLVTLTVPNPAYYLGNSTQFQCAKPGYNISEPPSMTCIVPSKTTASRRPMFHFILSTRYTSDSQILDSCHNGFNQTTIQYQQFLKNSMENVCNGAITKLQVSSPNIEISSENKIDVTTTVSLDLNISFPLSSLCTCADDITFYINDNMDQSEQTIFANDEGTCQITASNTESVRILDRQWVCQYNFFLVQSGNVCSDNVQCIQDECEEDTTESPLTTREHSSVPPTTNAISEPTSTTIRLTIVTETSKTTSTPLPTTSTGSSTPTNDPATTVPTLTTEPTTTSTIDSISTTIDPTNTDPTTTTEPLSTSDTTTKLTTKPKTSGEPSTTTEPITNPDTTTTVPTTGDTTTTVPTTADTTTTVSTTADSTTKDTTTTVPTTKDPTTIKPTTEAITTTIPTTTTTIDITTVPTSDPTTTNPTTEAITTSAPTIPTTTVPSIPTTIDLTTTVPSSEPTTFDATTEATTTMTVQTTTTTKAPTSDPTTAIDPTTVPTFNPTTANTIPTVSTSIDPTTTIDPTTIPTSAPTTINPTTEAITTTDPTTPKTTVLTTATTLDPTTVVPFSEPTFGPTTEATTTIMTTTTAKTTTIEPTTVPTTAEPTTEAITTINITGTTTSDLTPTTADKPTDTTSTTEHPSTTEESTTIDIISEKTTLTAGTKKPMTTIDTTTEKTNTTMTTTTSKPTTSTDEPTPTITTITTEEAITTTIPDTTANDPTTAGKPTTTVKELTTTSIEPTTSTRTEPPLTTTEPTTTTTVQPTEDITAAYRLETILKFAGSKLTQDSCFPSIETQIHERIKNFVDSISTDLESKSLCSYGENIIVRSHTVEVSRNAKKDPHLLATFWLDLHSLNTESLEKCVDEIEEKKKKALETSMEGMTVQKSCGKISYSVTVQSTDKKWVCPTGYVIIEKTNCEVSLVPSTEQDNNIKTLQAFMRQPVQSVVSSTGQNNNTKSLVRRPVLLIPQYLIPIVGVFEVDTPGTFPSSLCESQYRLVLNVTMNKQEKKLNKEFHELCGLKGIDIHFSDSLSIIITGEKVQVTLRLILRAMMKNVTRSAMELCFGIVISPLYVHEERLLGDMVLNPPACPSVQLKGPWGILPEFSCSTGYAYNATGFICSPPIYIMLLQCEFRWQTTHNDNCNQTLADALKQEIRSIITEANDQRGKTLRDCSPDITLVFRPGNISTSTMQDDVEAFAYIPFGLHSVVATSTEIEGCAREMHDFIQTRFPGRLLSITRNIADQCRALYFNGETNKFINTYWNCSDGAELDSSNQRCIFPDEAGSLRFKRSAEHVVKTVRSPVSPYWSLPLPQCLDTEPPQFINCPITPFLVNNGDYFQLGLPNVTDNSGMDVVITFKPENFSLPYNFTENTMVEMTAVDAAGNKNVCSFSVLFQALICPTHVVVGRYNTTVREVSLSYNDFDNIWRKNDSNSKRDIQPKKIRLNEPITVTVTEDGSSCNFTYLPLTTYCPDWSLAIPEHVNRTCTFQNESINSGQRNCTVACEDGYGFVVPVPDVYTCTGDGKWSPHNYVPDCAWQRTLADYHVGVMFNFTLVGKNVNKCKVDYNHTITNQLKDVMSSHCEGGIVSIEVTVHEVYAEANLSIKMDDANSKALTECVEFTNKTLFVPSDPQVLPSKITIPNCGILTFEQVAKRYIGLFCNSGFIQNSKEPYCVVCTSGTYQNLKTNECEACPVGSYQETVGATSKCTSCPDGQSTLEEHSKDQSKCIDICGPGYYSNTGLAPCSACPMSTYSENSAATICTKCPGQNGTRFVASTSITDCNEICEPGSYSDSGFALCNICPLHSYSDTFGSKACKPCSAEKGTVQKGSRSLNECVHLNTCEADRCENGGTCIPFARYFTCKCPPAYTGIYCEVEVTMCSSSPCENGGTCVEDGNPLCQCTNAYEGTYCESKVDFCASDPCINGVCLNGESTYNCWCYEGFEGNECQNNVDDCTGVKCSNGGVCRDQIGRFECDCSGTGYDGALCNNIADKCCEDCCLNGGECELNGDYCVCPTGFTGEICQTALTGCEDMNCHHGNCLRDGDTNICVCDVGYTGADCKDQVDNCAGYPCKNNGKCTSQMGGFTCECRKGTSGAVCEIMEDSCDSNPPPCIADNTYECVPEGEDYECFCKPGWTGPYCETDICKDHCDKGGVCSVIDSGVLCTCPPGYTGPTCSIDIDDCITEPCRNGGECKDLINSFKCKCKDGYSGTFCEVDEIECASVSCDNGGECVDLPGTFLCRCQAGWTGDRCETKIDNCISSPCRNGGQCKDRQNGYTCECQPGYQGADCELEIDYCASSPCASGGTCVSVAGGYTCTCPTGLTGSECEQSLTTCEDSILVCQNGGRCDIVNLEPVCICSPRFTGRHCSKEKHADFDILFSGELGSLSQSEVKSTVELSKIAVSLWVRFAKPNVSPATFFTLLDESSSPAHEMLKFNGDQIERSFWGGSEFMSVSVNDGLWHHMSFVWSGTDGFWSLYVDGKLQNSGKNYGRGNIIPQMHSVLLGQSVDGQERFMGDLSQVNVYNRGLSAVEISQMATNCSAVQPPGEVYTWLEFDNGSDSGVDIVQPSICGGSNCPPGYRGSLCDILIDKKPPVVEDCPSDLRVINADNRLSIVNWTEPSFSDDIGIANIVQTHRPGQAFAYGEYFISYTAYDAENNSASCVFQLFVLEHPCLEPQPPENGKKTCKEWGQGQLCTIECNDPDTHDFTSVRPLFFRCGMQSYWDPPRGREFSFPSCAASSPPMSNLVGSMEFSGPDCTEQAKQTLKKEFLLKAGELTQILGICLNSGCDFSAVQIGCNNAVRRRRRRELNEAAAAYTIVFDIPANGTSVAEAEPGVAATEFQTFVKEGKFDSPDFTADITKLEVDATLSCELGQILSLQKKCVNCAVGSFYNNQSKQCDSCPVGFYNNVEQRISCFACPSKQTTAGTGATSVTKCYESCPKGKFYSSIDASCKHCRRGYYQDAAGQTSCKTCPSGQTTLGIGAKSEADCSATCKLGQEINVNGQCSDCDKGTYRESAKDATCRPCPYGFTTPGGGTISSLECNIRYCDRGQYRTEDNRCELCRAGEYQNRPGQDRCKSCAQKGTRFTSPPGATDISQCIEIPGNECSIPGICHANATCTETDGGHVCTCNFQFQGNGQECTAKCANACDNHGTCFVLPDGAARCNCDPGYMEDGTNCVESPDDAIPAVVGGITAALALFIVILVTIAVICIRKKRPKNTELQTLNTHRLNVTLHKHPTAFIPFRYKADPSQLSLSEASHHSDNLPWRRSVFTSDESLDDASWMEMHERSQPLELDPFESYYHTSNPPSSMETEEPDGPDPETFSQLHRDSSSGTQESDPSPGSYF